MILEIRTGKDPNNVVRKYFKDRESMGSASVFSGLTNSYKLFDDDGNEIPLYIKKDKPVVEEVKEEAQEEVTTESDDTLEFLKDTKKRGKK